MYMQMLSNWITKSKSNINALKNIKNQVKRYRRHDTMINRNDNAGIEFINL